MSAVINEPSSNAVESVISAQDFYLAPPNEADCAAVAKLAEDKSFFFAPFNNAVRKGLPPFTAAAQTVFGNTTKDVIKVVRLTETNQFLGCIRFTDIKRNHGSQAELSYFFDPQYYRKYLGTKSILRAVDWAVSELGCKKLVATVDPENSASYKILKRAGFKVIQEGFELPEDSPYAGPKGEKRPRLIMEARVKQDIEGALAQARRGHHYSPLTPVV